MDDETLAMRLTQFAEIISRAPNPHAIAVASALYSVAESLVTGNVEEMACAMIDLNENRKTALSRVN